MAQKKAEPIPGLPKQVYPPPGPKPVLKVTPKERAELLRLGAAVSAAQREQARRNLAFQDRLNELALRYGLIPDDVTWESKTGEFLEAPRPETVGPKKDK
jgi:hypothetical protein